MFCNLVELTVSLANFDRGSSILQIFAEEPIKEKIKVKKLTLMDFVDASSTSILDEIVGMVNYSVEDLVFHNCHRVSL